MNAIFGISESSNRLASIPLIAFKMVGIPRYASGLTTKARTTKALLFLPRRCGCVGAGDGKCHHCFGWDYGFLFAGVGSYAGSSCSAGQRADGCALTAARNRSNHCAGRRAAADLGGIALGVALAFTSVSRA